MMPTVPFKSHWLFGHTKYFANDTLSFVLACAQEIIGMAKARIAFRDFIILLDHDAILHVLQKNYKNYSKSFAY